MTDNFYFDNTNSVVTLRCRALDEIGFHKHCFTSRLGGVSTGFLSATNLSFSREDKANVYENYRRIFEAVGFSGNIVLSNQQHTDIVKVIDREYKNKGFIAESTAVDGFVTDESGICLATFVADCVPVLIADPVNGAIACVHSGWRGTAAQIAKNAVELMAQKYGSKAFQMVAAIGPCIGKCCYEVGQDVFNEFTQTDHDAKQFFEAKADGKYMLDLNGANENVLLQCGLLKKNIHTSCECTFCNSKMYYSHRATKGKRGNMAAMIEI